MDILLLNQIWFVEELRALGHRIVTAGLDERFDVQIHAPLTHISQIIERAPDNFNPDRIVMFDNSGPLVVTGLEEVEIPMLFYSIDTHHHLSFHRHYYQLFDYTLLAQRDYLDALMELGRSEDRPLAEWMPLWSSQPIEPCSDKIYGTVFVGQLNAKLNPGRVKFFERLKARVPMLCISGEFWSIFPVSEIVINQTVKGDLNFRVFEALESGALLLTERTGNGLFDLFVDGEHLVTYEKDNVEEAAGIIERYLADPQAARAIAARGRAAVYAKHQPIHRAERLNQILISMRKVPCNQRYLSAMTMYLWSARRLESLDTLRASKGYAAMLECATKALEKCEPIREESAISLVMGALRYDHFMHTGAGVSLMLAYAEAYRHPVFDLAYIRTMLNNGRHAEARARAIERFANLEPEVIYSSAELMMSSILKELFASDERMTEPSEQLPV